MNTSPTPRTLSIWLSVLLLGLALTVAPASASTATATDTADEFAAIDEPSALAETNAAPGFSVFSITQCPSGYFCVWTGAQFLGNVKRYNEQSQYTPIPISSTGSFYNNRSKRVYVYNAGTTLSACYGPQASRSITTGWQSVIKGTYLSTATSC